MPPKSANSPPSPSNRPKTSRSALPPKSSPLSAELSGKVKRPANPNAAFDVNCRFEYISDAQFNENVTNLGSGKGFEGAPQAPCEPNPVTAAGESIVTAKVSGLTASTTYHQRLVAENASPQVVTSAASTFTTKPTVEKPKVLAANDATEINYRSAKFSGEIERPAGADPALDTYCRFEVVTDKQFQENITNFGSGKGFEVISGVRLRPDSDTKDSAMPHPLTNSGPTPVTATLNLSFRSHYHLRLAAENGGGVTYKELPHTFTTLPGGDPS